MKIILSSILLVLVACEEGQSSTAGAPGGGQTALIEEDVSTPAGDIAGLPAPEGDDISYSMPEDAPVITESCEPVQWSKDQSQSFNQSPAPAEPPPVDEDCVPIVSKSCTTACDCRFIRYHCTIAAANKDEPWSVWSEQSIGVTGGCEELWSCEGAVSPKAGEDALECRDGTCVAVGDAGHIRPLDLQLAE